MKLMFSVMQKIPDRSVGRHRHPLARLRRLMERRRNKPLRLSQTAQHPQTAQPLPESPPLNRRLDLLLEFRRPGLDSCRQTQIRRLVHRPHQEPWVRWLRHRLGVSEIRLRSPPLRGTAERMQRGDGLLQQERGPESSFRADRSMSSRAAELQ